MGVPATDHQFRAGLLYGLTAYGLWGLLPLYLRLVHHVNAFELFAHRIVWSLVMLAIILTWARAWRRLVIAIRQPGVWPLLAGSTVCIGTNWFLFIYGAVSDQLVYTSLGYFINPLVNILFGMIFFGERLRSVQWLAVGLACIGVGLHTYAAGALPWLSLVLAFSFGFYGLFRKKAPVTAVEGNTVETIGLTSVAVIIFIVLARRDELSWRSLGWGTDFLLIGSGPATMLPLIAFAAAARRLPLSVIGFLQYLAPSLQFLQAVLLFGEPLDRWKIAGFACIWTALAIFSWDLWTRRDAKFSATSADREDVPALPHRQDP